MRRVSVSNLIVETGSGERIIPTIRNPITLSKSEVSYDLAPPELGADSDQDPRLARHPLAAPRRGTPAAPHNRTPATTRSKETQ